MDFSEARPLKAPSEPGSFGCIHVSECDLKATYVRHDYLSPGQGSRKGSRYYTTLGGLCSYIVVGPRFIEGPGLAPIGVNLRLMADRHCKGDRKGTPSRVWQEGTALSC